MNDHLKRLYRLKYGRRVTDFDLDIVVKLSWYSARPGQVGKN